MRVQTKKRLLNFSSLLLLAATAGIVWWGLAPPILEQSTPVRSQVSIPSDVDLNGSPNTAELAVDDFAQLWEIPLRRPLYDPPPPKPQVIKKEPLPPIRAKLLATMIEPGQTMAMIQLQGGEVVFRKIGEVIGPNHQNAEIAEINPGNVLVQRGAETTRLTIEGAASN